jgi:hypothetical protein
MGRENRRAWSCAGGFSPRLTIDLVRHGARSGGPPPNGCLPRRAPEAGISRLGDRAGSFTKNQKDDVAGQVWLFGAGVLPQRNIAGKVRVSAALLV